MTDAAHITHYYLIDLENVGLQGLYGMNMPGAGSEIHIFLSNAAHTGTEQLREDILDSRAKIETSFCSIQGKNALDFQLAAYFGAILEKPETERISIISKDGGYRSLEDYAKKRRKQAAVYQGRSILEAFVAAENRSNPRIYEKGKTVDFKQIMAEMKAKRASEDPVRARLSGVCDGDMVQKVIEIAGTEGITAKEKYTALLKAFGREKGTEIYRLIKAK